ncbi:signaling lymphocytic activation molecule isoform X6 [Equus przewalskii]|uniref:Signaling lymphocytic activation molecule isoform X6 n=1 Tax=Equus przewalskii TaxID=9798 RepID=A0ABM4NHI7_EQUPR
MDPRGLLSLNFLLFLFLAFELSCGTGEGLMNCPKILGRLGSSVLLPLTSQGISKSMNESIHILVAKAESQGSSVKKKIVSLSLPEGSSVGYLEDGYKFHLENLSLEIPESRKKDEGWYIMTLEGNISVQHFCLQLKLYEQISTPEIKVLNRTQENGNCSLVLACMVEKGDHVAYRWSEEAVTHPLSPANGSHLLYLTLGPQHADKVYICTVSNPISSYSQTFSPWAGCRPDPPVSRQWGLYAGLCLGGIAGVIMILTVAVLRFRRRGKADHYRPTKEAKNLTIYAQVQKSGEPNSITVYASVTLPES